MAEKQVENTDNCEFRVCPPGRVLLMTLLLSFMSHLQKRHAGRQCSVQRPVDCAGFKNDPLRERAKPRVPSDKQQNAETQAHRTNGGKRRLVISLICSKSALSFFFHAFFSLSLKASVV